MMIIQKTDQPWLSQNRVKNPIIHHAKISPVGIIKEQRPDSRNQATKMRRLYILVVWGWVYWSGQVWSYWSNIYLDHGHVWIWRLFIRIIFIIFRFPGTVCRIVSLNFYRFWVTFYDFWTRSNKNGLKFGLNRSKRNRSRKCHFFKNR